MKWGWRGEGGWGWESNTCSQDPRHPGYTYTGLKYAQAAALNFFLISIQLFFKKSTQRRLVKPCKDAAGREDDLVTV